MYTELDEKTKDELTGKAKNAEADKHRYEHELYDVEKELEKTEQERPKYQLLEEMRDRLQQLEEMGADDLFWRSVGGVGGSGQQLQGLQRQINEFYDKYNTIRDKRDQINKKVQVTDARIQILNDEIIELQEQLEAKQSEFVVERESAPTIYRPLVMPWSGDKKDEQRFRLFVLGFLFFSALLGLLIPQWRMPPPDENEVVEIPKRLAELIVRKKQTPPPPPPEKKVEKKKPEKEQKKEKVKKRPRKDVPKPKTAAAKKARAKAERSGILAFKENFSELMDNPADSKLGSRAKLSNKGKRARQMERSLVTAQASSGSGGIKSDSISRNVQSSGDIGDVAFSRVESGIGDIAPEKDRPLSSGPGPARTDEEIQIVFDRYKAALYRIYNRELRKNPTLQGKMVLRITIEPDGTVSKCSMESSDLKSPKLEDKIVKRVKRFNFGPKEGVKTITILYPIDFLPAS